MAKKIETVLVPLRSIEADPEQPRKSFNPERLAELMASIKKYGIINPLVVERLGTGKFMLVDGERRFRASHELKLAEVPAIVRETMDKTERLIQQFHIQEQHEGWSATEKASAVAQLADRLKIGVREMAKTLALPERTISDYVAFANLLERTTYQKNEIPIHFAPLILALRGFTRRTWLSRLKLDFTEEMERELEKAIIRRIKTGDIRIVADIAKMRDSIKMDPKSALRIIKESKLSVQKLFIDTDADSARTYRNIVQFSANLASFIVKADGRVVKLFDDSADITKIRRAHEKLGQLLKNIA